MDKLLITGATGFIGRHCLPLLLLRDYQIHAVSSNTLVNTLVTPQLEIYWHQVDLLEPNQIHTLMAEVKPTHLLHLAWYTTPGKYWTSLENFRWVQSSLDLLQAFQSQGGQRAVIAGTCAEYDWKYGYCSEEITPLRPRSVYGTCKHALQQMADAFTSQINISFAWGRVFFIYGPGEPPQKLTSYFIQHLLQRKVACCSHSTQIRDFLYVKDIASAFVKLLETDVQGPVNIGSGQPITLGDLVLKIGSKLCCSDLIELGPKQIPADEPPLLLADIQKLRYQVEWSPTYNLDSGIEQTILWWQENLRLPD